MDGIMVFEELEHRVASFCAHLHKLVLDRPTADHIYPCAERAVT